MTTCWKLLICAIVGFMFIHVIDELNQNNKPHERTYSLVACKAYETNTPRTDLCLLSIPRFTLKECEEYTKELDKNYPDVYNVCVVEPNRLGE